MKLSKLYTNQNNLFKAIKFEPGLNVVMAEIRLPENRDKDTHNLGKTTLGSLINFCFLSRRHPNFFLFKHSDLFNEFVFYLEIELADSSFVTLRRSVEKPSTISFKKHDAGQQDFSDLPLLSWDHSEIPFDRSLQILDSLLDWTAIKPWSFRTGLGYQLRSQNDYQDVFQLQRHQGSHSNWKPFLAHILGFDAQLVKELYEKESNLDAKISEEQTIQNELGGSVEDISKIEGILLLKQQEAEKKQSLLDAFDFRLEDKEQTELVVNEIDKSIAELNSERYSLAKARTKIQTSLADDQILFNPNDASRLFKEAGVFFKGQIKKDFEQLIEFNFAITEERRKYLQEELLEIDSRIKRISTDLDKLGGERSATLSFLSETNVFNKYKQFSSEMVTIKSDITSLERQKEFLSRLKILRTEIRAIEKKCDQLRSEVESDVELKNTDKNSLFSSIRLFFNEIVEEVINRKALLSVSPNSKGHLEFSAEILDESGNTTSAGLGQTYRKLLCIAFDLAVLRAHLNAEFPRFVYHDGIFETLDDRKKENLLEVIRRYANLGLQPVITLIDSDLPPMKEQETEVFSEDEVIVTLHDENEQGRLFKMPSW